MITFGGKFPIGDGQWEGDLPVPCDVIGPYDGDAH